VADNREVSEPGFIFLLSNAVSKRCWNGCDSMHHAQLFAEDEDRKARARRVFQVFDDFRAYVCLVPGVGVKPIEQQYIHRIGSLRRGKIGIMTHGVAWEAHLSGVEIELYAPQKMRSFVPDHLPNFDNLFFCSPAIRLILIAGHYHIYKHDSYFELESRKA